MGGAKPSAENKAVVPVADYQRTARIYSNLMASSATAAAIKAQPQTNSFVQIDRKALLG